MAWRTDIGDAADPNPDKDQQYQQPDATHEPIEGRSFAGENIAATERQQADARNSGPPQRGNRTDDVQASDRMDGTAGEGGERHGDVESRTNAARTGLDAQRRAASDENL